MSEAIKTNSELYRIIEKQKELYSDCLDKIIRMLFIAGRIDEMNAAIALTAQYGLKKEIGLAESLELKHDKQGLKEIITKLVREAHPEPLNSWQMRGGIGARKITDRIYYQALYELISDGKIRKNGTGVASRYSLIVEGRSQ